MAKLIVDNACDDHPVMQKVLLVPVGKYISRIECNAWYSDTNDHPDDDPDWYLDSVEVIKVGFQSLDPEANDYTEIDVNEPWSKLKGDCEFHFQQMIKSMAKWFVFEYEEEVGALDAHINGA